MSEGERAPNSLAPIPSFSRLHEKFVFQEKAVKRLPFVTAVLLCALAAKAPSMAAPAQSSSSQTPTTQNTSGDVPDANASAKKAILANYRLYEQALKSTDIQDIVALETPDFQVRQVNGKTLNRSETNQGLRLFLNSVTAVHTAKVQVNQIDFGKDKSGHDTATAVVTQTLTATVMDKNHRPQQLKQNSVSQDVWILTDDQWKIQSSKALSSNMNVTGNQKPAKKAAAKRPVRRVRRR
jgi:hypothetical protein